MRALGAVLLSKNLFNVWNDVVQDTSATAGTALETITQSTSHDLRRKLQNRVRAEVLG